jgi:hypothetical protein
MFVYISFEQRLQSKSDYCLVILYSLVLICSIVLFVKFASSILFEKTATEYKSYFLEILNSCFLVNIII